LSNSNRFINIGCGSNPIRGFINYDYNLFILFGKIPVINILIEYFKFIPKHFIDLMKLSKKNTIKYCNASKRIPELNNSVDLIYCCHMLEHLDKYETELFLNECHRVLKPDGVMRIVVPDFDRLISEYKDHNDVNRFISDSYLVGDKPKTIIKNLQYLIQGHGWHHQMFTKKSLESVLLFHNYRDIKFFETGETNIDYNVSINYADFADESIYCEFKK